MSWEISAAEAKALVHDHAEIAFLDLREAGEFGEGHPLFAIPCPYSTLEARITALVPRRSVRVLLIDGGDGVAARAAAALEALGYREVMTVAGGAPAWAAAGYTLFQGVNVPSKTLGELAEHAWHPQTIDAETLKRWQEEGRPFRFFDARPPAEYAKMCVPGAVCLPNGELAHRFAAAVPGNSAPVVVTCAGRTRGIVGALGLRLAGIEAPIYALESAATPRRPFQPLMKGPGRRPLPARRTCSSATVSPAQVRPRSSAGRPRKAAPPTSSTCARRRRSPPIRHRPSHRRSPGSWCRQRISGWASAMHA